MSRANRALDLALYTSILVHLCAFKLPLATDVAHRLEVRIFDWSRPLGTRPSAHTDRVPASGTSSSSIVRVKVSNLLRVVEAPPLVVVACSAHKEGGPLVERFMRLEFSKVFVDGHGAQVCGCVWMCACLLDTLHGIPGADFVACMLGLCTLVPY